jgi:phosphatidylserine decarboxylase
MSAKRLLPVAEDGWKFIFGFLAVGVLACAGGAWFSRVVAATGVLAAVFAVYFFRDPDRAVPKTDDILSPADGRVMEVADIDGEGYGPGRVVRIFLSVLDVHVQRSPVGGRVAKVRYRPGKFLDARDPRAAYANESNALEIDTPRGRVVVRQIAGLIARRILCWARPEETLVPGERFGLIRFGSQVDLYLPAEAEILVRVGQRVTGGMTPVARWGGNS